MLGLEGRVIRRRNLPLGASLIAAARPLPIAAPASVVVEEREPVAAAAD